MTQSRIFRNSRDTGTALALAIISMSVIVGITSQVVMWNISDIKNRIEKFFQINLDEEQLDPTNPHAQQSADQQAEQILHGKKKGLFAPTDIGKPKDTEVAPRPLREVTVPAMPDSPAITPRDLSRATQAEIDRSAGPVVPLIAVRSVNPRERSSAPNLRSLYRTGEIGGGSLGRPGAVRLDVKPAEMPPQPVSRYSPPAPTGFSLPESAGIVTRRLVNERPARGYPSLDKDILATFTVYRKPGEQSAYFRLELRLRPESRLPATSKDILFMVDISQSISRSELKRIREAIARYITGINSGDRWNVVTFSEQVHFLHDNFVKRSAFDRKAVVKFIDRGYERRTNVYRAARTILSRIPATHRPCNVFLISDGKATDGSAEVKRMVHDFRRVNRENFSIFTFNAGSGGDLYLLSLFAYRSRGYMHHCPEKNQTVKELGEFVGHFDEPVLTNVVASYTNIKTEEVHPVVLPNLYREKPITFWGRTTPGREVMLRVAGRSTDGPREFFFRAVVPEGDTSAPEVVRGWARGKAHAMIARLSDNPGDRELRKEIGALAEKYQLEDVIKMLRPKGFVW